ncbi:exonuclease subunit SbcD [Marinomonas sp. 2405UD68-3]|uniref:exonuclease subunit SbcD n=1 Tax=Marinomonas sp. 2405UD68-3 TaxID=3391835 RepID=UPI0039C8D7D9
MKILHTSDWHLGQHFMGRTRHVEHKALIAWLLLQVQEHDVELIILSGDVFDTGAPPSYARELYNQLVIQLHNLSCQLIVLAGNHDSVSMLNESKHLLACLSTSVIAKTQPENKNDHVIEVKDRHGNLAAIVCAVPFIRPKDLMTSEANQSEMDKKHTLLSQIQAFYFDVFKTALETRRASMKMSDTITDVVQGSLFNTEVPIIGTGHLTTLGAKTSESVRDIYIGTLESIPAQAFPPFDYLALGHIHRAQVVAGNECQRYSGSPICLSFDELNKNKSMVLLDTKQVSDLGVFEPILLAIPSFQSMKTIRGDIKDVLNELTELVAQLDEDAPSIWLEVKVTTDSYLNDVQKRIQEIIQGSPVDLLRVTRTAKTQVVDHSNTTNETLTELTVEDVFERCLASSTLAKTDQTEDIQALKHVFNECLSAMEEGDLAP